MRFLFINSFKADYVEDQLFAGLTELLGKENVVPYPVNKHFYLPLKRYPRNMGLSRGTLDYLTDLLTNSGALKSMEFDAVIIGSTKRDTFEHYLRIAPRLPAKIPLIYVDGGDWEDVGGDARRMNFESLYRQIFSNNRPLLVFKRECLIGRDYDDNVIPFPMAYRPMVTIDPSHKKYDVTAWCVESHEIRTRALTLLEQRYDCAANGTTRGQTFRGYSRKGFGYLQELAGSRIACNFRGVGWDTMRYWEIPGVNAFMVSQRPGIVIPDNFVDGEHASYCRDDLSDLIDKLDYFLKNDKEREEIAAAGHRHLLRYHTHRQRAELFLARVKEKLGNSAQALKTNGWKAVAGSSLPVCG